MLRRNSSRNKQRRPLSRSKSTSAIVRNPVHSLELIDPAAAERDAHLAALLSFHRADGRHHEDMAGIPEDPASFVFDRNDSVASAIRRGLRRSDSVISRQTASTATGLKRQQSVRFAGPSAPPRRHLASRASQARTEPGGSNLRAGVAGQGYRPASTLSYGSTPAGANTLTRRYLHSLQFPEEYYTPEDDIASEPSSYRRLRRSKSMFAASHLSTSEYYFDSDTPGRATTKPVNSEYVSPKKENEPLGEVQRQSLGLRAPKSMSFLRNLHNRSSSRSGSQAENDLAVHLARDKLRQQVEKQRLQSTSIFTRSKSKRSENSTGLRKSMRDSSNDSEAPPPGVMGSTLSVPKGGSLRRTARKVSQTLRTKLKGLFIKSRDSESSEAPEIEPARSHHSGGDSCLQVDEETVPEEASMCQVPSHVPSLHAVPSHQRMRSSRGSVESADTAIPEQVEQQDTDDKSRVTSWTNSITNTVSSRGLGEEPEMRRLSAIDENGLHGLSYGPRYTSTVTRGPQPRMTIDSQRVYSALMKRVEEAREKKRQEQVVQAGVEINTYEIAGSHHSTAEDCVHHRKVSTIRCVEEEDDVFQDRPYLSPPRNGSSESLIKYHRHSISTSQDTNPDVSSEVVSPQKQLSHIRGESEMTTQSHRTSAFFASPTSHLFRTVSPFRRALQENMRVSHERERSDTTETKYLGSLSALSLPLRRSESPSDHDPRMMYAESVYSSAEDAKPGHCQELCPLVESFPQPPQSKDHGDVTIFIDTPSYKPTLVHKRDVSTASSVEWKTWLSANVSKLEASASPPRPWDESAFGLPRTGHIREPAEIESPEDTAARGTARQEETPTQANATRLQHPLSTNALARATDWVTPNRDENKAPPRDGIGDEHSLLSLSSRTNLRSVPSLPTVQDSSRQNSPTQGSKIPRMRSMNTINSLGSPREELVQKRRSRTRLTRGSSTRSSPGLTAAVERQFGAGANCSPTQRLYQTLRHPPPTAWGGSDSAENLGDSEKQAQAMGSKRIVDLFLNSRRRRIDGSGTDGSSPAFL